VIDGADETLVRFIGEYLMRSLRYDKVGKVDNPCIERDESQSTSPSPILTLFTSIDNQNLAGTQTNLVNAQESQWLANTLTMYLVAGSRREVSYHAPTVLILSNVVGLGNYQQEI
jgi:hypothetical protein